MKLAAHLDIVSETRLSGDAVCMRLKLGAYTSLLQREANIRNQKRLD